MQTTIFNQIGRRKKKRVNFLTILSFTNQYGQGFRIGEYSNGQGGKIIFNSDSTFLYSNYFARKQLRQNYMYIERLSKKPF